MRNSLPSLRNGLPKGPHIQDQKAMVAFGEQLASSLKSRDLVFLRGPLGAGKTTLVKGMLKALVGIDPESVQSPTYSYVHPYEGGVPVFHFDLYRLEDESTFFDLDLDAYLSTDGIGLIEWPERVPSLAPLKEGRKIEINISYEDAGRRVEVEGL